MTVVQSQENEIIGDKLCSELILTPGGCDKNILCGHFLNFWGYIYIHTHTHTHTHTLSVLGDLHSTYIYWFFLFIIV